MQTKNLTSLHWRELIGNPFLQQLHPDMLEDEGKTIAKQVKRRGSAEKEICEVHYDREYIYRFIEYRLLKPLGITSASELSNLLEDYYQWKQRMNRINAEMNASQNVSRNVQQVKATTAMEGDA